MNISTFRSLIISYLSLKNIVFISFEGTRKRMLLNSGRNLSILPYKEKLSYLIRLLYQTHDLRKKRNDRQIALYVYIYNETVLSGGSLLITFFEICLLMWLFVCGSIIKLNISSLNITKLGLGLQAGSSAMRKRNRSRIFPVQEVSTLMDAEKSP